MGIIFNKWRIFLSILPLLSAISLASADSQNNLVLYLPFDDNTNDLSGSNNHGANNGAVFVDGVKGKALQLDGVDDYVSVRESGSIDFQNGDSFSVSQWFKTGSNKNCMFLAAKHRAGSSNGYLFGVPHANPTFCHAVGQMSYYVAGYPGTDACSSPGAVNDNKWHHTVGVYDSAINKVTLYIDGVAQQDTGSRIANIDNAADMTIGWIANSGACFYEGLIDEVKIWSKALTEAEIKAEYDANKPLSSIQSGSSAQSDNLIISLPLDGDLEDASGNNNNGVNNGATFVDGIKGKALQFNGNGNYVKIPQSPSLITSNSLTYSYWLNLNSIGTQQVLINNHRQNVGSPRSGVVTVIGQDGRVFFQLRLNNICCTDLASNQKLVANRWYHVANVWDGSNMLIYINGKLDSSRTGSGTITVTRNTYIGVNAEVIEGWNHDPLSYLDGAIDEVKILNKALSSDEISRVYIEGVNYQIFDSIKQWLDSQLPLTDVYSQIS